MIAPRQLSDAERLSWLQLARTDRIGPVTFASLLTRYGTAEKALAALPDLARAGRGPSLRIYSRSAAEKEVASAAAVSARFVAVGENGYPPLLRHAHGAPPLLCISGHHDLASNDIVAIVGARNASANGLRFTRMVAQALGENGMTVVSGLARGIDTAAHEASLKSGTLAVVAGGIDHYYPPENEGLQKVVAEQGLLISEMPPGTAPKAEHFPRRNRIISGMARAVIVIEAALRSGSLITARFAAEQGRDVYAVPGSPLDPRAEGSNRLIRDGATILTSIDDVLESLRATQPPRIEAFMEPTVPADQDDISPDDRARLLSLLSPSETPLDDIIRESGIAPEIVAAILLELEVAGRVQRSSGGRVALLHT